MPDDAPSPPAEPVAAPRPTARRGVAAALAVGVGILLSRIAGLVRERIFAHYLGNSDGAGAFKAALRIPNLLQNLFGEGVLSASFIPVYARLLAQGAVEEAGRVAGVVASLLTLVTATLVALGVRFSPQLIEWIAPGFTGDVRALTIRLVQIMFPGVGLLVLSAWCLGVLNSHRRFFLSYVAPVLWNVAMIVTLVAFGRRALDGGRAGQMRLAEWVAWATVAGAGLQLLVQIPVALSLARGVRPSLALGSPEVRQVVRNFAPVVLSRGVVQLSAYIDQLLASYLGAAAVAGMAYAQTLYLLPVSLFGMSISAAELPAMSGELGDAGVVAEKVRARLEGGLRRIAFYVVPSVMALLALGDVVIATLFQTGAFHRADTLFVWAILAGSTVGLLAATQARLCSSTFYALGDTRTPLAFAVVRVALTAVAGWACALPLRAHFGWSPAVAAAGLTASAGLAGWLEFLLLARALARRVGRFSVGAGRLARLWGAAALAALVGHGARLLVGHTPLAGRPIATGLFALGAYGAVYFATTGALRVDEASLLLARVRRVLGRGR